MGSTFLLVFLLTSIFSFAFGQEDSFGFDINPENYKHENSTIEVGNPPKKIIIDKYFNHTELEDLLRDLGFKYKHILRVVSLGDSAGGIPIWAARITRNVKYAERRLGKPMFKYVANSHGDEAVGYALMVSLIQYLVYSDRHDTSVTEMLDKIEIWIVPCVNPDGFKKAVMGNCDSLPNHDSRDFANKTNLDCDFPHKSTRKKPSEVETQIMSEFIKDHPFVLSGNLKGGGAIVASYPFDHLAYGIYRWETKDDDIFRKLAKNYISENEMMASGKACDHYFTGGAVKGWILNSEDKIGSMQDFNYVFTNCFEISFYLSCCKYPHSSLLPLYWEKNLKSMLKFIQSTLTGVHGQVKSFGVLGYWRNKPINFARIKVQGSDGKVVKVTNNGEYWRLLVPGKYNITASASGFRSQTKEIELTAKEHYKHIDFMLKSSFFI